MVKHCGIDWGGSRCLILKKMSQMVPGEEAEVKAMDISGGLELRLRELGLSEGACVRCVGRSPLGDPCAYLVSSAVFALRRSDADYILMK